MVRHANDFRAVDDAVKALGQRLAARDVDRQVAELQVRAAILNGFTARD